MDTLIKDLEIEIESHRIADKHRSQTEQPEPDAPDVSGAPPPEPEPEAPETNEPQDGRVETSGGPTERVSRSERLEAAARILRERGPLHKEQLWEALEAEGFTSRSKFPADSLSQGLSQDPWFEPATDEGRGYWRRVLEPDASKEREQERLEAALGQIMGKVENDELLGAAAEILSHASPLHAKPLLERLEGRGYEIDGANATAKYLYLRQELDRLPLLFNELSPYIWALRTDTA